MNLLLIVLIAILTMGSSLFSLAQISFFSLSSTQLKLFQHSTNRHKQLVVYLLRNAQSLLVILLMCDIATNILIQNTASTLFSDNALWLYKIGVPLVLTLILGELLPKSIAFPYNTAISWRIAPIIYVFYTVLSSPLKLLTSWIHCISRVMFCFLKKSPDLTRRELECIISTSGHTNMITPEETQLLRGYLSLHDITVKQRMVPRHEIFIYDINHPLNALTTLFSLKDLFRIPVVDKDLDHLLGIIDARTFLVYKKQIHTSQDLIPLLQKPFYLSQTISAKTALKKLFQHGCFLAVILDEYGSVAGILSREDLYEVVIGEITDKHEEKSPFTQVNENAIIASGKLEIIDFEQIFQTSFHNAKQCATIGGWLTETLGDIPKSGTRFSTEHFFFHVLASDPNRIRRVFIKRLTLKKR